MNHFSFRRTPAVKYDVEFCFAHFKCLSLLAGSSSACSACVRGIRTIDPWIPARRRLFPKFPFLLDSIFPSPSTLPRENFFFRVGVTSRNFIRCENTFSYFFVSFFFVFLSISRKILLRKKKAHKKQCVSNGRFFFFETDRRNARRALTIVINATFFSRFALSDRIDFHDGVQLPETRRSRERARARASLDIWMDESVSNSGMRDGDAS